MKTQITKKLLIFKNTLTSISGKTTHFQKYLTKILEKNTHFQKKVFPHFQKYFEKYFLKWGILFFFLGGSNFGENTLRILSKYSYFLRVRVL